VAYDGGLGVYL